MKIDAHQHFWNLEKVAYPWLTPEFAAIYRTFEPPELEPLLQAAGIDKTVLVQSANSAEDTRYMLDAAAAYPWIGGVVGWVPLDRPDEAGRQLEAYAKLPVFKGIRHLIHDEPDPDWVVREEVLEGLRVLASFDLSFDVVAVFPNHLKHVPVLAEKVPGLRLVIDHLAKPPLQDAAALGVWKEQMARAAEYPQVFAKVSGLNTVGGANSVGADWKVGIDFAREKFGANRLMFGSDWPVALLAHEYATVWAETGAALADYSAEERAAILGGTAAAFYRVGG